MIRILYQLNSLNIGGVETFTYRLCKYAKEDVAVVAHEDGVVRSWLEEIGIPVYIANTYEKVKEIIEDREIDILVMHTGSYLPSYVNDIKEAFPKLKLISVLHTSYSADYDNFVDKIICVSAGIYSMNNPNKSVLIYPGIERKNKFVLGDVTRLATYKYIEDLINIVESLVATYPDVYLKIIGKEAADHKGYRKALDNIIMDKNLENNIEFVGYLDEIPWPEFDAFIHFVGNEAYPVTILEALDRGIRTITYSRIGTQEIKLQYPHLILVDSWQTASNLIAYFMRTRPKHIKETAQEFTEVYKELML